MWMDKQTKNGQMDKQTKLHQFQKKPSFDSDICPCQVWIWLDKPFSSSSPETKMWTDRWMDRQTNKKQTNEKTKFHQFRKEPSYDDDLSPCQVWIQLDKQFLSPETKMWTNGHNYTNFKRNLAKIVIYVPSSMNLIGQTVFELESGNKNGDGQMDGQTNGQMNRQNFTNFERNLAMMLIYLPVKFEFDQTNRFWVRVRKRKMWTDRQMDVKHIKSNGQVGYMQPA